MTASCFTGLGASVSASSAACSIMVWVRCWLKALHADVASELCALQDKYRPAPLPCMQRASAWQLADKATCLVLSLLLCLLLLLTTLHELHLSYLGRQSWFLSRTIRYAHSCGSEVFWTELSQLPVPIQALVLGSGRAGSSSSGCGCAQLVHVDASQYRQPGQRSEGQHAAGQLTGRIAVWAGVN